MSEPNSRKEPYELRRSVMEEVIRAMNRANPKGYYTVSTEDTGERPNPESCMTYFKMSGHA